MKNFKDKVAVVTGAASGIGRGLAGQCAKEGMKVVVADIEEARLRDTEKALKAMDADVMAVKTDVSKFKDIEALQANQARQRRHAAWQACGAGSTVRGDDA